MTDPNDAVLYEKLPGHVALVTLNRPDAMNAVSAAVTTELERIVNQSEGDDSVRVVILTGAGGRAFCAGADLKEVSNGKLTDLISPRTGFAGFVQSNRTKPWLAAVDGFALAGGCEIALACDLIVASENSSFGLPEVTRGLIASAGGLYRLPRALPIAIAKELILTAGKLSATRAAELGMVNRLAPKGEAVAVALRLAAEIANNAPLAVRESLAIASAAFDHDDRELHALSLEAQARIMETRDFQEGPLAFVEKRAPRWTGT
ncbi:MAG: enoyl-CoA hydratase-related protein [Sphingobium sp.]|uniref:enoyl-CoA hydratase-related protein n=1 Tax=Sphingobium sp. TaxID=1912891 RepID=UPI0029B39353|nr:enoyl-CoA hydratase-related protein [Sphingobium sp.]MDX3911456.1 enoyl-CoA hydratase-related protein [Sphingobium sp.]